MLRTGALCFLCLIAWTASRTAVEASAVAERVQVIAYMDADTDRVRAAIAKFEAALQRRGIKERHQLSIRHVPIDVFNREEIAARLGPVLRDRPALVIATSSESA